jgi:hypothetical protein
MFVRYRNVLHCGTLTSAVVSNSPTVRLTFLLNYSAVFRLESQTIKILFQAEETFFFLLEVLYVSKTVIIPFLE